MRTAGLYRGACFIDFPHWAWRPWSEGQPASVRRPHRDYASWNLSVNLYTVNAPWLFSLLWCAGVPSVTSDNTHVLSQVPSPLWIMVSWEILGGQRGYLGMYRESLWHRVGGRLHTPVSGEVSRVGSRALRRIFVASEVCTMVLGGGEKNITSGP